MNKILKLLNFVSIVIILSLLSSCNKEQVLLARFNYDFYFNTSSYICIEYNTKEYSYKSLYNLLYDDIDNVFKSLENTFSKTKPSSKTYNLNNSKKTSLNNDLKQVLSTCICASSLYPSYDITINPIIELYDISKKSEYCFSSEISKHNKECVIPSTTKINEELTKVDYNNIIISNDYVELLNDSTVDFGSVVKGYALDLVKNILDEYGFSFYLLNFGGSIYSKLNNTINIDKYSSIFIKDPFSNDSCLSVNTSNSFISTSGVYERFIEIEGIKYHHIFNALTGMPANTNIASVTVFTNSGIWADILSTILLIEGINNVQNIIDTIDQLHNININCIIITDDSKIYNYKSINEQDSLTISIINDKFEIIE